MYSQIFSLHADLLKALAHERRLEIIHLLRDQSLCVSDIQQMLALPQANLSQHLQILREAGVLNYQRQGKQIYYSLSHPNFVKACDLIREILIQTYQNQPVADDLTKQMSEFLPLVVDPVCGMRLSPKTAGFAHQHQGQTFYFCASGCFHRFQKSPYKYTSDLLRPSLSIKHS